MLHVKIYGERNCGTNFLEQLITRNFNATIIRSVPSRITGLFLRREWIVDAYHFLERKKRLGWKHGQPPIHAINDFDQPLIVLTISKNPYSFLLSLHRQPYHNREAEELSFEEFLSTPWPGLYRDLTGQREYVNPMHLWNIKNTAYLKLNSQVDVPVYNMTYEQLLSDPNSVMESVKQLKELRINSSLNIISTSTKRDGRSYADFKDYYLHENWKKELSPEAIASINAQLDKALVKQLGYTIL